MYILGGAGKCDFSDLDNKVFSAVLYIMWMIFLDYNDGIFIVHRRKTEIHFLLYLLLQPRMLQKIQFYDIILIL